MASCFGGQRTSQHEKPLHFRMGGRSMVQNGGRAARSLAVTKTKTLAVVLGGQGKPLLIRSTEDDNEHA